MALFSLTCKDKYEFQQSLQKKCPQEREGMVVVDGGTSKQMLHAKSFVEVVVVVVESLSSSGGGGRPTFLHTLCVSSVHSLATCITSYYREKK
jgi:hypothetical protein